MLSRFPPFTNEIFIAHYVNQHTQSSLFNAKHSTYYLLSTCKLYKRIESELTSQWYKWGKEGDRHKWLFEIRPVNMETVNKPLIAKHLKFFDYTQPPGW